MPELYIIGNGFDKEHGLKTSYWNFREYLEKYEEDFLFQMERMYDFVLLKEKIIETEKISNGKNGGMMHYISICGGHLSLNYLMRMKLKWRRNHSLYWK